jgi:hypothetical protein
LNLITWITEEISLEKLAYFDTDHKIFDLEISKQIEKDSYNNRQPNAARSSFTPNETKIF